MPDKSRRQPTSKKPGKSVKEKRVMKKARKVIAENDRMAVFLRGEPPVARNYQAIRLLDDLIMR